MSQLDEVLALGANNTAGEFALSGDTLAVLFYALDFVQDLNNWRDYADEELDTATVDEIRALVDNATDSLMRPIVTIPIGSYLMHSIDGVPPGYLDCDGSAVSRTTYADLFAVIGINYGAGNGTTTFNLPEWAFQSPMGMGLSQDGDVFLGVGGTYGEQNHALLLDEMPEHTHRVPKQSATVNAAVNVATPAARTDTLSTPQIITDPAGGSDAHNTVHPVQGIKMLIYTGVA